MTRSRTAAVDPVEGEAGWQFTDTIKRPERFGEAALHSIETCVDTGIPWVQGLPFTVHRWARNGGVLHRPQPPSGGTYFINWAVDSVRSRNSFFEHLHVESPSDTAVATKVAAGTNPNKSYVDLGVMVGELRELPQLAFKVGSDFIKGHAKNNLTIEFGLKPLLSDIRKMFEFQKSFDRRLKNINTLADTGRLSRRMSLGSSSNSTVLKDYPVQSYGRFITRDVHVKTTETVWGHVTWTLVKELPSLPSARQDLASKALFGQTLDLVTLWELLPWSWLIDWFSNAGELISLTRGIIPATHGAVSVMRHKKTTYSFDDYTLPDGTGALTSCEVLVETKSRVPVSPALEAQLPFLTNRQMSILGSIALTRMR